MVVGFMTRSSFSAVYLTMALLSCGQPLVHFQPPLPPPPFVAPASQGEIEEIALQHSGCLAGCSVYSFSLRRRGASVYEGGPNAVMQGRYEVVVDSSTFRALAQVLLDRQFFAMDSVQSTMYSDTPTIEITAVLADSRRKHVMGQDAPRSFHDLAAAIDSVGVHLAWHLKAP